jgi:hypothetical protein
MLILLAAQASAPAAVELPPTPLPSLAPVDRCSAQPSDGDIVVCGKGERDPPYRLRPVAGPEFKDDPVRAKLKLSESAEMDLHGESGAFGVPRAMVTFKLRF